MIKLTNTTEQTVATGAALTFNSVLANTLESIRTIWSSSDPELKKRMKADLTALVGELTV